MLSVSLRLLHKSWKTPLIFNAIDTAGTYRAEVTNVNFLATLEHVLPEGFGERCVVAGQQIYQIITWVRSELETLLATLNGRLSANVFEKDNSYMQELPFHVVVSQQIDSKEI